MNYLNNKDLREEIIICKQQDELTPRAIDMFMLLSEKVADNYTYKDPEDRKDISHMIFVPIENDEGGLKSFFIGLSSN